MVLEGVHLVPGMLPPPIDGAIVVQCVLAIEDEDEHRRTSGSATPRPTGARPVDKYLDAASPTSGGSRTTSSSARASERTSR